MYKFIYQVICILFLALPVSAAQVAYWSFNGSDGITENTAIDNAGDNDGTIYGAVAIAGKIGQALSFDGINDYVVCGNDASLNITDAITLEAWVKFDTFGVWFDIISKELWISSSDNSGFLLRVLTGGKILFYIFNNQQSISETTVLSTDTWYHIVGTSDGAWNTIYINGIEKNSVLSTAIGSNAKDVYIGRGEITYFSGAIDEVRIYNEALTPAQILINYQKGRNILMNPASLGKVLMNPTFGGKLKMGEE